MTKIEALELELAARKMVEGAELEWWQVVRRNTIQFADESFVNYALISLGNIELALGIIEGKPVWAGDKIWIEGVEVEQIIFTRKCFDANKSAMSWNPPPPKTVNFRERLTANAEDFDSIISLILAENAVLRKALEELK